MVAAAQPEIRLRLDREERALFEHVGTRIGMSANDMVRVFIKRTIAVGGLPFARMWTSTFLTLCRAYLTHV